MTKSLRLWLWYCSIVVGLTILLLTGLVPGWGEWYSPHQAYRMQTESMLHGELALSHSPDDLSLDLVWANDGVQQVWGLGVPAWRLPFEAVARLFGQPAFPDRLALAIAMILVAYGILVTFTMPAGHSVADWLSSIRREPERLIAVILIVAFPPVIALCRGPFLVYEEVIVYGYIFGIGLFLGLISFHRRPRLVWFLSISFFSGLAVFIRPTLGSYGLATLLIALTIARNHGWHWSKCVLGPVLFGLAGLLLCYTNHIRFGSGVEFGHSLNLPGIQLMYISRFGFPFHEAPLWGAAKELFGSLFLVNELNGFNDSATDIVFGQVPLYRWRHFYTTTFDLTYLAAMLIAWLGLIRLFSGKKFQVPFDSPHSIYFLIVAWSLIASVPLFLFYLRHSAISSRYMLDFAPAIAVAMTGGLMKIKEIRFEKLPNSRFAKGLVVVISITWLGWQYAAADFYFPPTSVLTRSEMLQSLNQSNEEVVEIPAFYSLDSEHRPSRSIFRNGAGWKEGGATEPMVVLFIDDPKNIVLEVASVSETRLTDENCRIIRAKVGLEFLELNSIEDTVNGKRLTFSAPNDPSYQSGIQVLFLAFVEPQDVTVDRSPFRLLNVRWR